MTLHLRPSRAENTGPPVFRQKPDGNTEPAAETGWFLQRERERIGKSLADAALETHINAKYLNAIETGALDHLPAGSYALGYIRVYADFLGLEAEPLLDHYRSLIAGSRNRESGGIARTVMLGVAGLAFVAAMGAIAWYVVPQMGGSDGSTLTAGDGASQTVVMSQGEDDISTGSINPQMPTGTAADDGADTIADILDSAVPTVVVRQEGLADDAPAAADDGLQPDDMAIDNGAGADNPDAVSGLTEFIRQHVSDAVTDNQGAAVDVQPEGTTYGTENADARLVLTANRPVWIRVEDKTGRIMITRTLQSGDSYRVPNREGLVLIARDGGALDYVIDGQRQGAIGAPGEIVVGRSLDVSGLARSDG